MSSHMSVSGSHMSVSVWVDDDTAIYARITGNGNPAQWLAIDLMAGLHMPSLYLTETAARRLLQALTEAMTPEQVTP